MANLGTYIAGGAAAGLLHSVLKKRGQDQREAAQINAALASGELLPAMRREDFEAWLAQYCEEYAQAYYGSYLEAATAQMQVDFDARVAQREAELTAHFKQWLIGHDAEMVADFNRHLAEREQQVRAELSGQSAPTPISEG